MSKKPKPDIRLFFKQRDLSELNDTTTLSSSHHHEDTEAELVPAPTCPSNDLVIWVVDQLVQYCNIIH